MATLTRPAARRVTRIATTIAGCAALALGAGGAIVPSSAHAWGTFTVHGACAWHAWSGAPTIRAYHSADSAYACPNLSVDALGAAPSGAAAGWTFYAPAGTTVIDFAAEVYSAAGSGWNVAVYRHGGGANGAAWLSCPGSPCFANPGNNWVTGPGHDAGAVVARMQCFSSSCPGFTSALQVRGDATVTLQDTWIPNVSLLGPGTDGQWKRDSTSVTVGGADNTGIQRVYVYVDGQQVRAVEHGCNYGAAVPCANASDTVTVPLSGVPDGAHMITARAVDAGGNVGSNSRRVLVDNTPPATAVNAQVAGGAGWRASDTRRVVWTNPAQRFAPITGVRYTLCPVAVDSKDPRVSGQARRSCRQGSSTKTNVRELPAVKLPAPGAWVLRAWLVDAAGNADAESAVRVAGLGFDPTPPTVAGFTEEDPRDPARVSVKAGDAISGVAGGAVEVRRRGTQAWRPLPTEVTVGGISAFVDDEKLRKGTYELRATVTDHAGLQQGTDRTATGQPKTLKVPIRQRSTLTAGKPAGKRCERRRGKRRCSVRLATKPQATFGHATRLRGRLEIAGKPIAGQALEVWRHLAVDGAAWQRIGTVTTSKTGRFRYKVARGPAATIRFRYPGTPHVRGRNANVTVRVRARSTLRVNDRRVLNGESVMLSGRLGGGWQPPTGALVEMQVRSGGKWRTFATARADAHGRFSYLYRFTTVRGHARFAMRARVRRQPGYPFYSGHSRRIYVHVRG